ncbi:glucagon-like peptide 2 receptor [Brienomyrus brachyistius]|uniref:glucagon-like peptide 2 receptor n=1 Tax=Brienomyrus brachyistius TaxID=42636 RepID=UPI0020B1F2C7|nr:glucagon-like peptide 2 receptor [Brienomyrus brachyistius]
MATLQPTRQHGRQAPENALLFTVLLLLPNLQVMGSILEDTIYKRTEYWENCTRTLASSQISRTGIYCNGSFDHFVCWPHSPVGNVSVPCPSYLPWIKEGNLAKAYRECTSSGTWRTLENSTDVWRDQSECINPHYFKPQEDYMHLQTALRVIYMVGYSLSLSSLTLAVLIMGLLRKLHCTRNYIHMNLFISFIFRAAAVMIKEIIFQVKFTNLPTDDTGWKEYTSSVISVVCKASQVSMHYFVGGNYFWLLVEAIFLHRLLFTAVLTKRRLLKRYLLIGWGTPFAFVVPWTVTKVLYENQACWPNKSMWIWWIIRGPITLSVVVIFYIFIKIMKLLLSKLKADQVKFADYRNSLARATLVLIPLLGIHEVVFTFFIDEYMEDRALYVRNFINLTLSSFQGLLVAILYCFANGEVQAEVKKRWQLFLFANHYDAQSCFQGIHMWKCSRRRPSRCPDQWKCVRDISAPSNVQQQWLIAQAGLQSQPCQPNRPKFNTRRSLSSSEGEMTLGDTMEEVLEESMF